MMYNNVLVPVTVHFNILIFTVFKLFLITLHPPIHLLRRGVLNNAAFIRKLVVNSMVKLLQNFLRYKYNCLIYSHILNQAGLEELSVI